MARPSRRPCPPRRSGRGEECPVRGGPSRPSRTGGGRRRRLRRGGVRRTIRLLRSPEGHPPGRSRQADRGGQHAQGGHRIGCQQGLPRPAGLVGHHRPGFEWERGSLRVRRRGGVQRPRLRRPPRRGGGGGGRGQSDPRGSRRPSRRHLHGGWRVQADRVRGHELGVGGHRPRGRDLARLGGSRGGQRRRRRGDHDNDGGAIRRARLQGHGTRCERGDAHGRRRAASRVPRVDRAGAFAGGARGGRGGRSGGGAGAGGGGGFGPYRRRRHGAWASAGAGGAPASAEASAGDVSNGNASEGKYDGSSAGGGHQQGKGTHRPQSPSARRGTPPTASPSRRRGPRQQGGRRRRTRGQPRAPGDAGDQHLPHRAVQSPSVQRGRHVGILLPQAIVAAVGDRKGHGPVRDVLHVRPPQGAHDDRRAGRRREAGRPPELQVHPAHQVRIRPGSARDERHQSYLEEQHEHEDRSHRGRRRHLRAGVRQRRRGRLHLQRGRKTVPCRGGQARHSWLVRKPRRGGDRRDLDDANQDGRGCEAQPYPLRGSGEGAHGHIAARNGQGRGGGAGTVPEQARRSRL